MLHGLLLRASDSFDPRKGLSEHELKQSERYRHPGRRRQFLLGRAAARRLLVSSELLQLDELGWIERTEAGWPRVLDSKADPVDVSLSISHSKNLIVCALCPASLGEVGVDLEQVDIRTDPFYEDYFSDREQELICDGDGKWSHSIGTLMWVIKEAVLKSLKLGLTIDARSVEITDLQFSPGASDSIPGWSQAQVKVADNKPPKVLWRWIDSEHHMALAMSLLEHAQGKKPIELDWEEREV